MNFKLNTHLNLNILSKMSSFISVYFQIYNVEPRYIQTNDNLVISSIQFKVNLQNTHFQGVSQTMHNGLTIRCTADIPNLYQQSAEVELGVPQKDPVPARGKQPN